MNRTAKRFLLVFIVIIAAAGSVWWLINSRSASSSSFRTVSVVRGDIMTSISATGTVEPEEVVNVGAQVAGKIVSFGTDHTGKTIDYGSTVEEGTILAKIDDSLYAADVAQSTAQLEQAKAGLMRAEADLVQLQARLVQAERDWNRAKKLGPSDALSQSDYDASHSAYEVAKANVAVGKAAIAQAKSAVAQATAALQRSRRNLDYCTIKSPVKGVIIDRRVNIGQTVVASLNAPSLFLIAKDLRRMQIWVSVNEADIGHIHPGQKVTFTVDAYPGETFEGNVGKVRLNASMTQNVVTYTVEVHTDNSNGKLLPYLTANAKFHTGERLGVLTVPNAALRYNPDPDRIAVAASVAAEERSKASSPAKLSPASQKTAEDNPKGTLWIVDGASLRPVKVTVGMSDGIMTEVQSRDLQEGTPVVVGEEQRESASKSSTGNSPFIPQFPGRSGSGRR